jgi:hypothetical protein
MDTTTLIILGIIVLLAAYLFNRNRTQPRGTYDNKDDRSSGSIGRGPAYDDEDYRSSGSIGGSPAYDDEDFDSGGTIGGQKRTVVTPPPVDRRQGSERPRHDSPDFKSGGSIGGNSSPRTSSARPPSPSNKSSRDSDSSPSTSGDKPALRGRDAERK